MEFRGWEYENIQEKLKEEDKSYEDKRILNYEDNYFAQQNNYCAFNAVTSLLACSLDYSEKNVSKIDSIEGLKEKMKNELDVSFISSFKQRLNHVTFQHPSTNVQFPKFSDLIPQKAKSSKKCKTCKKLIVQAGEGILPKSIQQACQKLEICHLFLNQFPCCLIYRVDPSMKILLLKFILCDFKDIKISFIEVPDSPVQVYLPPGIYEIGAATTDSEPSEYVFNKSDRWIILNFKFKEDYFESLDKTNGKPLLLRFKVKAVYNRGGVDNFLEIEYLTDVKFKL